MPHRYWLVKQEPADYPWARLVADRRTPWTGVRNFQARNHLWAMQAGDLVLWPLIRQSRLSVVPVSAAEFRHLLRLGQTSRPAGNE